MKIYKYVLEYSERQTVPAKILKPLSIKTQGIKTCLWAIVDENAMDQKSVIRMYGTGYDVPSDIQLTYISTVRNGSYVFHYFIEGVF